MKGGKIMFERILYPTDFSDVSMKALKYVKQLKDAGAKEVTVLHVIDERTLVVPDVFSGIDFMAVENELRKVGEEKCKNIVAELQERGLNARYRIEKGIPFLEILKVSREEDVSLIVIGSHGVSNVRKCFLVQCLKKSSASPSAGLVVKR
jgi:nucleotide-binding universal stress UspA family protein